MIPTAIASIIGLLCYFLGLSVCWILLVQEGMKRRIKNFLLRKKRYLAEGIHIHLNEYELEEITHKDGNVVKLYFRNIDSRDGISTEIPSDDMNKIKLKLKDTFILTITKQIDKEETK